MRSVTPARPVRCRWGSAACNPISGPPGRHAAPRQRGRCTPAAGARACDWTARPPGTLVASCWPRRYDYAVAGEASVRPLGTYIAPRRWSRCDPANDPARDPTCDQRDRERIAGDATTSARAQRPARQPRMRPNAGGISPAMRLRRHARSVVPDSHAYDPMRTDMPSAMRPRRRGQRRGEQPPEVSRLRRLAAGATACGSALGGACGRQPKPRSSVPAPPSR